MNCNYDIHLNNTSFDFDRAIELGIFLNALFAIFYKALSLMLIFADLSFQ
jgi:hypothetical protein